MYEKKKIAFFLPNMFTALNIACGFSSILFAVQGRYYEACMILILGAIFDSVDGRVARLTGTQSSFGEQFDSISDVVSFGVAPSMLMYFRFMQDMGRPGIICAFVFLLCGALRLARFNANIDKVSNEFFQGLPIPGAALALIGFVFLSIEFPIINDYPIVAMVYSVVYGLFMISNIPFNSFKKSKFVHEKKKQALFILFVIFSLFFVWEELMLIILISIYVFGSLIYFLINRSRFVGVFDWKEEE